METPKTCKQLGLTKGSQDCGHSGLIESEAFSFSFNKVKVEDEQHNLLAPSRLRLVFSKQSKEHRNLRSVSRQIASANCQVLDLQRRLETVESNCAGFLSMSPSWKHDCVSSPHQYKI